MLYLCFIQEADCQWLPLHLYCMDSYDFWYAITRGYDLPINLWNKEYELGLPGK